ncbi:PREDICTED: protocadherin beta-7-like, partial [Merops nubicus]|uniref:protocadherin beta-7-like n=1 Tax=Merops nubicus TaxID=57421 RepID=UPI0004F03AC8
LLLADPLQFWRVEVAVSDINDHSTDFPKEHISFKILGKSDSGSCFLLEGPQDLDVGSNSDQAYSIAPKNEYFIIFGNQNEDNKYVELVLEKLLNRDVEATHWGVGAHGDISYQFSQGVGQSHSAFGIDPTSGEIKLAKALCFEVLENNELSVQATDGGGLLAVCKVLVEEVDVNDNTPEVVVSSFSSPLPKNTLPATVVALFAVKDQDGGYNGKICDLEDQLSFCLWLENKNYYELVTVSTLDPKETARYIVIVTAADTFRVDISDVNDNAPVFNQTSYTIYVHENKVPLVLIVPNITIRVVEVDDNNNAPVVLYPAQDSSPQSSKLVPMLAGYLVTKVVAVDGHLFQNLWLLYHMLKTSDPRLFAVGAQSGEVQLQRSVTERDVVRQKLIILVRDNGQPPLTATAALSTLLLHHFSDVHLLQNSLAMKE